MAYLVLARKWRPQTFDEVLGQPHVTRTLQNAIQLKRTAHAYLFTGARGVGKTSVARILAKTLNCEREISANPCNECSNCREITQGNAVDVLEIDGASNRGIDNIRELRETVRYRPAKSRYKIYIIDEVHMLTTEAFNALLKTLEEPPDHVLFIFATTEPHKIPSTILSRCQRFDFRRISTQQIVKHLKEILTQEKVDLSEAVLYSVSREADGSMRDAQSLLEQLLAFSGDGLSDEEILDVLGVVDRRSVHRVGEAILAGDVRTCLQVVGDLYRRGIDSRRFCQQLCDHFRNLLFLALGESDGCSQLDLPQEERKLLLAQLGRTTSESLYLFFQMILKGEEEIRRSSLPRISLEMLLLRLTQLPRLESLDSVLQTLAVLEKKLRGDPACAVSQMDATPSVGQPMDREVPERSIEPDRKPPQETEAFQPIAFSGTGEPEECNEAEAGYRKPEAVCREPMDSSVSASEALLEQHPPVCPVMPSSPIEVADRWPSFLQWLHAQDVVLAAKLNQSRLVEVSDVALEVEVLEVFQDAVSAPQTLAKLTEAGSAFFGHKFQWVIRGRSSFQPERGDPIPSKRSMPNPRQLVMEHPVVQQALDLLGGELVDIRHLKPKRGEQGEDEASHAT